MRCVRSNKFGFHIVGALPTFALAVPFADFGMKETFPTTCSLSQADPHLIPLKTLELCKTIPLHPLTFKNLRSIYRTGVPLPSRCCILYIFSTNISTEYFKHAAHSPFFSSKCRVFHNATFFVFCIIHILHTGCPKI